MKKIIILLFIMVSSNILAQDYFWDQKWSDSITPGLDGYLSNPDFILKLFAKFPADEKSRSIYTKVDKDKLIPNSDGYIRTSFFGGKQIMMYGGNWIIFASETKPQNIDHYSPHMNNIEAFNKGWVYYYSGIKNVISENYLTEKSENKIIEYKTDDLNKNIIFDSMIDIVSRWNHEKLPWVEGEDGPGIGVTLDIEFEDPSDHLLVVNGYVDFGKTYLYKANNRVKDAVIRSLDPEEKFEIDIHFDDVVRFHEFRFPSKSKKVQFEIKSVYKGDKWDDTAITGFQLRNPENMYDRWKDDFLENAVEYEDWMEFEN